MQGPILGTTFRRLQELLRAVDHSMRVVKGFRTASAGELNRVGLFEKKGRPTILRVAYLTYYWLVFVIVLFLPTWKDEPVAYFAALLALGGAWLIALPQLGASISSLDFSTVKFGGAALRGLGGHLRAQRVEVPRFTAEEEKQLDDMLPPVVSAALPMAILDIVARLATRAVALSAVALLGLLVGPRLADAHFWLGWSPVSILYAIETPWALALLASLITPVLVNAYIAARRLHDLEPPTPPTGPEGGKGW